MKISDKKRSELYECIHEPVMKLRIELSKKGLSPEIDHALSQVVNEIWSETKKTLKLPDYR